MFRKAISLFVAVYAINSNAAFVDHGAYITDTLSVWIG